MQNKHVRLQACSYFSWSLDGNKIGHPNQLVADWPQHYCWWHFPFDRGGWQLWLRKSHKRSPFSRFLSPISAIQYPSWDDLGRTTEQQLTRSTDHKKSPTTCSYLNHFFGFLNKCNQLVRYLTNNTFVTNKIIGHFTVFIMRFHYSVHQNPHRHYQRLS